MKKVLIGIGAVVVIAVCLWVVMFTETFRSFYYTRIDNSNIEQLDPRGGVIDFNGGMSFAYNLSSYDQSGKKTKIRFGTSRILNEGAFIKLTVIPIRGVIDWEEVSSEQLPEEVRSQYPESIGSSANNGTEPLL